MERAGHLLQLAGMGSGVQDARRGSRALRGAEGHALGRAGESDESVPAVRRARSARVSRLVLPVAAVRRRPARQRGQLETPAGADPVLEVEAGPVVVQPGTAAGAA